MKKRLIIILIFLLVGIFIIYSITKNPTIKWTYDLLPNQYAIKKTSNTKVVLGKYINNMFDIKNGDKIIGVEDYIAEFKYGNNYIALKCLEVEKDNIIIKYYIIDTKNENVYGPYLDEETYNNVALKIIDEDLNSWQETINMPKDAVNK